MAFYLVSADLKEGCRETLLKKMHNKAFKNLQPFGTALSYSLENAKVLDSGRIAWEEEDYCTPPLAQERKAVFDKYFDNIRIKKVDKGEGWKKIKDNEAFFSAPFNSSEKRQK